MYRHQRPISTFIRRFSRNSFPSRENGEVRVQRVRLVRPVFRGRILPRIVFVAVTMNLLWVTMGRQMKKEDKPEEEESVSVTEAVKQARVSAQTEHVGAGGESEIGTEEKIQAVAESEDDMEYEDDENELVPEDQPEDAWFIPLWFARECEKEYYAADDPEWEDFIEFNQDHQHRRAVKHTLVKFLYERFVTDRKIRNNMGPPIKIGRVWLEFYYPQSPPTEWERLGIEITDDYVALLHRPIDARNASRVNNTIWPQRALWSFWASLQTLWRLESDRFQDVWNQREDGRGLPGHDTTTDPTQGPLGSVTEQGKADKADSADPNNSIQIAGRDNRDKKMSLPLVSLPQPSAELQEAMVVFRRSYAKSSQQKPAGPPRGSLICAGLIEFVGTRDIIVVDVQAFYNPYQRAITYVDTQLQSVRPVKLAPRASSREDEGQEEEDGNEN